MTRFRIKHRWLTILLIIVNVLAFFIISLYHSFRISFTAVELLHWGALFNPFTLDGQYWRVISSMFMHAHLFHIAVNMYSLWSLGAIMERRLGKGNFLLLYFVTGFGSAISSLFFNTFLISVGASGAIFGLYGFYISSAFTRNLRDKNMLLTVVVNFLIFVVLNLIFSRILALDLAGHLGGFATGIIAFLINHSIKKGSSVKKKTSISLSFLLVSYSLLFLILPQWQVTYFKAFQTLLETEHQSNEANAQKMSDDDLLIALKKEVPLWKKSLSNFTSLSNDMPSKVSDDKNTLVEFQRLTIKEMEYKIKGIERESYIYLDSISIITEMLRNIKPINYPLNLTEAKEKYSEPSKGKSSLSPSVTVFYDSSWNETYETNASFYRIGSKDSLGLWSGFVTDFYIDGKIQMKGKYKMGLRNGVFIYYTNHKTYDAAGIYENDSKRGKWEYFHENGKLAQEVDYPRYFLRNKWDYAGRQVVKMGEGDEIEFYPNGKIKFSSLVKNGNREGKAIGYYENGAIKFKEVYHNGRLLHGISRSLQGDQYTYDASTLIPLPEGGYENFYKYLNKNKKYPPGALQNSLYGKLQVKFSVDIKGNISDFIFLNRLGLGYEEAAQKLLLEGPKWTPAKLHGFEPFKSEVRVTIDYVK